MRASIEIWWQHIYIYITADLDMTDFHFSVFVIIFFRVEKNIHYRCVISQYFVFLWFLRYIVYYDYRKLNLVSAACN